LSVIELKQQEKRPFSSFSSENFFYLRIHIMVKNIQSAVQALAPIALSIAMSLGIPSAIFGFIMAVLSGCQSHPDTNSSSVVPAASIALIEETTAQAQENF
jgi:hypothetical protein